MKKGYCNQLKKHRFTLIEVVIVIVILVTLASIATPMYLKYVRNANIGTAKTQIKLLSDAIVGYKTEVGKYPDSENGLRALLENVDDSEKWQGPYLNPAILPKDPWGNDYVYTCPGEDNRDFDIVSYGADGEPGGEGENADITSWEQ